MIGPAEHPTRLTPSTAAPEEVDDQGLRPMKSVNNGERKHMLAVLAARKTNQMTPQSDRLVAIHPVFKLMGIRRLEVVRIMY